LGIVAPLLVPKILILSMKALDCAIWLRIHCEYALRLSSRFIEDSGSPFWASIAEA